MHRGYTKRWRKRWDKGYHQDLLMWVLMDYFIDFANHKTTEVYIKGYGSVQLHRGQHLFGTKKLADFFGTSRRKVRLAIERLQNVDFLSITASNRFSIATVINYDTYQPQGDNNGQQNVQPASSQRPSNGHQAATPKELKELKECKETDLDPQNPQQIISAAIKHLNDKVGVGFDPYNYTTQTLILDRINEGAGLEDFKAVINKKCSQWLGDTRMQGNLRPATLFAPDKFEGYLQEAKRKNNRPRPTNKPTVYELLGFGYDVLTKFGEDKFKEFCAQNNIGANDIEAIRQRAQRQGDYHQTTE